MSATASLDPDAPEGIDLFLHAMADLIETHPGEIFRRDGVVSLIAKRIDARSERARWEKAQEIYGICSKYVSNNVVTGPTKPAPEPSETA